MTYPVGISAAGYAAAPMMPPFGYAGAPVRQAAAQAAQVGAQNVVAQTASTITQAANVAENAAVAAEAFRHPYPSAYYATPQVVPAYPTSSAAAYQPVSPYAA